MLSRRSHQARSSRSRTARIAITSAALAMAIGCTQAFAFPSGMLAGVAPGQTWVVCQGYNNTSISHSGTLQYSLDLTADLGGVGSGGCTGSATTTGNRQVVAPGNGTTAWNDGSGFCLNFDAGDSMKLYHTTGPPAGSHVNAGQVVGNVYPAGQGQNAGYAHLHIAAYGGAGCASGNRTPFAGSARLGCGAPDMSSNGAFNQWAGTQLTNCGGGGPPPPPPPPDRDGDGYPDASDVCPDLPGIGFSGCPTEVGEPQSTSRTDFNGDGKADYCRRVGENNGVNSHVSCTLSTGSGFGATVLSPVIDWGYEFGRAWTDVNADGKADYCRVVGVDNGTNSHVSCTPSTGSGFGATVLSPVIDWGYQTGRVWTDFNGDGKADYCRRVGENNGVNSHVSCTLSTGSGFGATVLSPVIDWGYETGRAWVDFNGDGKADYCRRVGENNGTNSHVSCTLSTSSGFGATVLSPVIDWGYQAGRAWTDFNGDGAADYCRVVGVDNGTNSHVSCTLSTGSGFGATVLSPVIDWGYETGRAWVDFNGDGKADYCRRVGVENGTNSHVSCTLSTGSGFGATVLSPVIDWGYETGRAWVDLDGDGKADYCRVVGENNGTNSHVSCTPSTGSGFGATVLSPVIDWGYDTGGVWAGEAVLPPPTPLPPPPPPPGGQPSQPGTAVGPSTGPGTGVSPSSTRIIRRTLKLRRGCSSKQLRVSGGGVRVSFAKRLPRSRCRLTLRVSSGATGRRDLLVKRGARTVRLRGVVRL